LNFIKTYFFVLILLLTNLLAQENFLVETKINASFKMGSMQSESKTIYSEDIFFSNVEFAFKGKGVARLMSREMHTGTIISLNDSTVSNIDFKKKKFSVKTFNEIHKDKENKNNQNENDNQDNSDNENINEELKFFISEESELINGFEAYKLTIERDGTNEIWFSKTLREPDFVINIKNEISEFQNSWADMSIDLTEYGIDKDSIIVKMSTESDDGNFNFDLISFQKFLDHGEELKVPEDYKKVRKI
tara:strand:+ start:415 stop:1155 length:741 start_codon:yes stop_codon:yes gene_type:complete